MKRVLIVVTLLLAGVSFQGNAQTLRDALDKKDTVAALGYLKKGGDINKPDAGGSSALMMACKYGEAGMVHFLLWHGATPDKPKTPKGRTSLIIACAYYCGKNVCSWLIDKGANVNAVASDGVTALMMAAKNAKLDVVELLLKSGANPKLKDAAGKTALEYAKEAEISEDLRKSMKDTRVDKGAVVAMLEKAMKK